MLHLHCAQRMCQGGASHPSSSSSSKRSPLRSLCTVIGNSSTVSLQCGTTQEESGAVVWLRSVSPSPPALVRVRTPRGGLLGVTGGCSPRQLLGQEHQALLRGSG